MKTHWKKAFKSDYLSSSDVDGRSIKVTIKEVNYIQCTTQSGKKYCNVAFFTDTVLDSKGKCTSGTKPMILNVTNSKTVKKFAKDAVHIDDWNNIPVEIYVDSNVKFGSDFVEGLRIKETPPKTQSQLIPLTEDKFKKAVDFLQGGKTMDNLKSFYYFDSKMETRLILEAGL